MATVYGSMRQSDNSCASFAVAGTSAHICVILDTVLLAVSIFIIILLVRLLVGL